MAPVFGMTCCSFYLKAEIERIATLEGKRRFLAEPARLSCPLYFHSVTRLYRVGLRHPQAAQLLDDDVVEGGGVFVTG